jgi:hypothetical protein
MNTSIVFASGVFLGATLGIITLGLCTASKCSECRKEN